MVTHHLLVDADGKDFLCQKSITTVNYENSNGLHPEFLWELAVAGGIL